MGGWSLSSPWLLLGLLVLPALWWLLRVTPPAPRRVVFPSVALLLGLGGPAAAARMPAWLLALRLAAAALAIAGLAGPVWRAGLVPVGGGSVVVVIDNGWAAAADWPQRLRAAGDTLAGLAPPGAPARLLATAADPDGSAPALGPETAVRDQPARLAALRPRPWPVDGVGAAAALAALPAATRVIYVADGVATAGSAALGAALRRFAAVTELRGDAAVLLLRPPVIGPDGMNVGVETLRGREAPATLEALDGGRAVLAATAIEMRGGGAGRGTLVLPPELQARVTALRLRGPGSAAAIVLLDETAHRRPVGLIAAGTGADQALVGPLFYVRRALAGIAEVQDGTLDALLGRRLAVMVMPDGVVGDPARVALLTRWVRGGGVLVRFAGPLLAAAPADEPLLPGPLLVGDRALGGTMSWSRPAALAPFPAGSPFAGLAVPAEVSVTRQVLGQPGAAPLVWAALSDSTPLVTAAPLGKGSVVLFHVTANAAWSNLPLSGLFPRMLDRLVQRAAGVSEAASGAPLAPRVVLDGFGDADVPGGAARALPGDQVASTPASPEHPPGLYGPAEGSRALNLSATLPPLIAAAPVAGAVQRSLGGRDRVTRYDAALIVAALLLLAVDTLASLRLRGLVLVVALLGAAPARAEPPAMPSLATHLAYVVTGDAQADGIAEAGLHGLSAYVNARTAAVLADPVGVDPAVDDLSLYPLLYWPVLADQPALGGATLARLDAYMQDGGIILFDTRDGGADAGAEAALRRIGQALSIPPLTPLTTAHVLSRAFYLLRDWPGRADGPVWVAGAEDRANDGVSPVIVGGNDWGAAWAVDAAGDTPYSPDGGEAARVQAYRFGVNVVMYALTGNYKADQVHVPELLRRMGDPADAAAP